MMATRTQHESKRKLLDAALHVIRAKGYTATRVEDICEQAGLTKGSFFHHFKSKEELALAAVEYWNLTTGQRFRGAAYHAPADPVDRLLAYVDFRRALLKGELPEFTCLVGTMVQEVYETHPQLREACEGSIWGHASTLEPDIAEAMRMNGMKGEWTARSLALHAQAVIQGSFILAKAHGGPEVAAESIDHLRRYLELLFGRTSGKQEAGREMRAENEHDVGKNERGTRKEESGSKSRDEAAYRLQENMRAGPDPGN
jgi:TetR/AcrR family transcriptional repressor of nem operon